MKNKTPNELEIFSKDDGKTSSDLFVKILENGDLSMEGQDIGEAPQRTWGHDDYEYNVKVPAEYKNYLLLLLIKERFPGYKSDSDFMEWLKAHNIPYEFSSWP